MVTKNKLSHKNRQEELLEVLLIAWLARAGVTQNEIRKIVGVNANKVSKIARHFIDLRR